MHGPGKFVIPRTNGHTLSSQNCFGWGGKSVCHQTPTEAEARDYSEGLVPQYFDVSFYILKLVLYNRRPVSSVGRAPDCRAGGRRLKPGMTSANGQTFKSSRIRTINRRPRLTVQVWDVKESTHQSERVGDVAPGVMHGFLTYSLLRAPALSNNILNCVAAQISSLAKSPTKGCKLYKCRIYIYSLFDKWNIQLLPCTLPL